MSKKPGWDKIKHLPSTDPRREKARISALRRWHTTNKFRPAAKRKRARKHGSVPRLHIRQSPRDRYLKNRFGITEKIFDTLLLQQNGCCAICRCPETTRGKRGQVKRLAVDHCHSTSRIRGLLCQACNAGIGLLKDSPTVIAAALDYLQQGLS